MSEWLLAAGLGLLAGLGLGLVLLLVTLEAGALLSVLLPAWPKKEEQVSGLGGAGLVCSVLGFVLAVLGLALALLGRASP